MEIAENKCPKCGATWAVITVPILRHAEEQPVEGDECPRCHSTARK